MLLNYIFKAKTQTRCICFMVGIISTVLIGLEFMDKYLFCMHKPSELHLKRNYKYLWFVIQPD